MYQDDYALQKSKTRVNQQKSLKKMNQQKGMMIGGTEVENKNERVEIYMDRQKQQNQRGISKEGLINLQIQKQKQKEVERMEIEKGRSDYKLKYKK